MAVHCGVCARRLSSAADNGGSFSSTPFGGWDKRSPSQIQDTCEGCAALLRKVVGEAAFEIRSAPCNAARVEALRRSLKEEDERRQRYERLKAEALAEAQRRFHSEGEG